MAAPTTLQNNMASTLRFYGSRLANLGLLLERNIFGFQNARGIKQSKHTLILFMLKTDPKLCTVLVAHTEKPDGTLVIAGSYVQSSRVPQLIRVDEHKNCNTCYMCNLNLDVKHTVNEETALQICKANIAVFSGCVNS